MTGYNAFEAWEYTTPTLTSVVSPAYEMGAKAGQSILYRLHLAGRVAPWRHRLVCRLGVIYPGDGDTELRNLGQWLASRGMADVEVEFVLSATDGSHSIASLEITGGLHTLRDAAGALTNRCNAVAWACASGSFFGGMGNAVQQLVTMGEIVAAPVTSTSIALVRAVKSLGTNQIEILSPYPRDLGRRLADFFEASSIDVLRISDLDAASGAESRLLDLEAEVKKHQRRFGVSARPLIIPDTAINTMDILETLERRTARPVITANQASVWDLLRLAGCSTKLKNAGTLFQ